MKSWFNNNGRPGQRHNAKPLLNLQPKRGKARKRLSLVQAYSKRYFPTKIKPIYLKRYEEHLRRAEETDEKKMKALDFCNKVVREFWEQEPQNVKDAIAEYREHRFQHGASSDEDNEGGDDDDEDSDEEEGSEDDAAASIAGGGKGKQKMPLDPVEAKAREYHA